MLVDRKKDLNEVAQNLCSQDSSRFWRELRRAHSEKKKLIILVEHGGNIKSLQDVSTWKSKYSTITGRRLQSEMYRIAIAYGVQWEFCSKKSTGKRIVELLEVR